LTAALLCKNADFLVVNVFCPNISYPQIYIASYYGDDLTVIDSAKGNDEKKYILKLDKRVVAVPGMFRLIFGRSGIDLILNDEDVFVSICGNVLDSIHIDKSDENKMHLEYIRNRMVFQNKLVLFNKLAGFYKEGDSFLHKLKDEVDTLQKSYEQYIKNCLKVSLAREEGYYA
jgi:hypothetical protein